MTNTTKYSIGALALLILLYLGNQNSQSSYKAGGEPIYSGSSENVHRILLTEEDKKLELVRRDTTWKITQADSFTIKEFQVEKVFDRLLKVEQEMLISSKAEKWSKFGVDDSSGRHFQVYDENNNPKKIPEKMLPVELPRIKKIEPTFIKTTIGAPSKISPGFVGNDIFELGVLPSV